MSLTAWLLTYGLNSLFWWWLLAWGGARWVEGWKSFFLVHWLAPGWSAEGIRLFALLMWIATTLWFVAGLVNPGLRDTGFLL